MAAAKRRGLFGGRRRSNEPRRVVSLRSKLVYFLSLFALAFFGMAVRVVITMDESNAARVVSGGGVLCLIAAIGLLPASIRRIREEGEPAWARLLSVAGPVLVAVVWGYVYLMGFMKG